jgi:MoaA/NifB/PqqE/SkfB family radical SAM enzyme
MLLNQREWDKFPGIHDMVDTIRISTDGATKATFEKLRRGGRWEIFYENLQFLADMRDRGIYKDFWLSFTYQIENFREMPAFVDMCRDLSPDACPLFEKLENWGTFDPDDYKRMAVHHLDHPLHDEFLSIIQQPRMRPVPGRLIADYAGLL